MNVRKMKDKLSAEWSGLSDRDQALVQAFVGTVIFAIPYYYYVI